MMEYINTLLNFIRKLTEKLGTFEVVPDVTLWGLLLGAAVVLIVITAVFRK